MLKRGDKMVVNIDESELDKLVKDQVREEVRRRIKEMQGSYTSKGYLEDIIRDTIWDKIYELCPDVEEYLRTEAKRCIDCSMENVDKISKQQLVGEVIDGLFERFKSE